MLASRAFLLVGRKVTVWKGACWAHSGAAVARLTPELRAQWPLVLLRIRVFVGVWNLSI